jgi:hypothetical protein
LPQCGESAGGFEADKQQSRTPAAPAAETRLRPIAAGLTGNNPAAQVSTPGSAAAIQR